MDSYTKKPFVLVRITHNYTHKPYTCTCTCIRLSKLGVGAYMEWVLFGRIRYNLSYSTYSSTCPQFQPPKRDPSVQRDSQQVLCDSLAVCDHREPRQRLRCRGGPGPGGGRVSGRAAGDGGDGTAELRELQWDLLPATTTYVHVRCSSFICNCWWYVMDYMYVHVRYLHHSGFIRTL